DCQHVRRRQTRPFLSASPRFTLPSGGVQSCNLVMLCRHGGALADHELWTQELKQRLRRLPVDHADEHFYGSQRGLEESGLRKVIVADNRNVLGYSNPLCA